MRSALALAAGLALTLCPTAAAQQPAPIPPELTEDELEGRPVRELILRSPDPDRPGSYLSLSQLRDQESRNNIRTLRGRPLRADVLRDDVQRLNRLSAFRRVESLVQPLEGGGVRVIITLVPQPLIQGVEVVGNRSINDDQLLAVIGVLEGTAVDRFQIDRSARRVEDIYREQGFYLASVTIDEDALEQQGIVIYRVREGTRVKITDIRFESIDGALAFRESRLRREIETKEGGLFRKGEIDETVLDRDISTIIDFYRDRGFLDARADYEIRTSPDGSEAILGFVVEQGPAYTLRDVRIEYTEGSLEVLSEPQAAALLTIKPGDRYGVRDLVDSLRAISDALGQMGYTSARVARADLRDPDRPLVDMVLTIETGPRYRTGEVIIQGDSITRKNVILRQTEIRPGRPLSTVDVERTEVAIQRLRLFNPRGTRLTLQPPDPAEPEYRDVLIEVEETNTGSFDLGGAVTSDAGIIGRIALTQRNFDIANPPDSGGEFFFGRAFRGAGQTFSIEALPGDEIERYTISLSEPFLFETDYSGSAQAFYRDRDFDEFDERRFGGRFSLGRRFGSLWSGSLNSRIESVEISNILPDSPVDIFELEGEDNAIIGVGPRFVRNTLDNQFLPTRGSRTEFGVEQVFGDFDFTRFEAQHSVFIPLARDDLDRATVLELSTSVGYIPQGEDEAPVFERFYLGGNSFRGFEFRTISPRSVRADNGEPSDDPVGGTWQFFAGLQLRQPIFQNIVSAVAFIDTGTVTNDPGFEDYRVSVGAGLRISIPQLSPAPLAFDFGFPLLDEETDESQLFSFSIDLPF